MPPKMTPKSKMGFFTMRPKASGKFGIEFSDAGFRFWLDTYTTADKDTRAYDGAVWRAGRPKMDLNFPKIETRADAEFFVPEGIRMEEIPKKKTEKRPLIVVGSDDSDEAAMVRFAQENPEYVQAEQEYF
ncbi:ethylene-responsive transcription factor 1-like [Aegilops tauschii subsp. strangulata]|uniref:ethylene-responsive transcription factor 1-like n=1 Tax=Aegilops tauschii subsp. strangulata TaxID=200361 RepID=UPI00098A5871|nr:ethylene-responsive transcription factor ERF071-like [Aegilops tauschii subsp. strangulata]